MKQDCLEHCGRLVTKPANRCPTCQAQADRARGTTTQRGYGHAWRTHSQAVIREWRARNGDMCPGWAVGPHKSSDLVLDHHVGVLCRGCNSRKAATYDKRNK